MGDADAPFAEGEPSRCKVTRADLIAYFAWKLQKRAVILGPYVSTFYSFFWCSFSSAP